MNELAYQGYTGSLDASIEDACLHGRILWIDDIVTYEGETVTEIRAAFEAAVDRYIAHCARVGKEPNRPFSGSFNIRIGPELHGKAARAAFTKGVKLNEYVKLAIQAAVDSNGVVTHEHHHQHDVNVTVKAPQSSLTLLASMGEPTWQDAMVGVPTPFISGKPKTGTRNGKPH